MLSFRLDDTAFQTTSSGPATRASSTGENSTPKHLDLNTTGNGDLAFADSPNKTSPARPDTNHNGRDEEDAQKTTHITFRAFDQTKDKDYTSGKNDTRADGGFTPSGSNGGRMTPGPHGRFIYSSTDGGPISPGPDGRPISPGPDGGPIFLGSDGGLISPGPDGGPISLGPDGGLIPSGPDGGLIPSGIDGGPISPGPDGGPISPGPYGGPIPSGPDGGPISPGPDGGPIPSGPDGGPIPSGPDGGPISPGPDGGPTGILGSSPSGEPPAPSGELASTETLQQAKLALSATSIAVTLMGLSLNIPSLVVFWRSSATLSNTIMIGLLGFETIALVVHLPIVVMDIIYRNTRFVPLVLAYFRLVSELTVTVALRRTIVFLTTLMTLDRFLMNTLPLFMRGRVLVKKPKLAILLILVAMLVFSTTETQLRWRVLEMFDPVQNTTLGSVAPEEGFLTNLNLLYFFVATNVLFLYLPGLMLIATNLGLLVFLLRHEKMLQGNRMRTPTSTKRSSPTQSVAVIIAYSVVTFTLNLPLEIYMSRDLFSGLENWGKDIFFHKPPVSLIPSIVSSVNVLSWSVDFFIYFAVSSRFRNGAKKLFGVKRSAANK